MTDLEITRLCAKAMGYDHSTWSEFNAPESGIPVRDPGSHLAFINYDPIHDDAQAMALEDWLIERGFLSFRRGELRFNPFGKEVTQEISLRFATMNERRRAICECVVKHAARIERIEQ